MSNSEICRSLDGSKTKFPSEACVDAFHFNDSGLRALTTDAKNAKVRVLDLTESKITDDGLHALAALANLERLYLTSITRITDAGILAVCKCTSLRELCILDTGATDDGLQQLLKLPHLECLRVGSHDMDGSGLAHLHAHPALRFLGLDIHYNDQSRACASNLQAARPDLVISW